MKNLIDFYPDLVTEVTVEDKKEPNDDIRSVISYIKDIEKRNGNRTNKEVYDDYN